MKKELELWTLLSGQKYQATDEDLPSSLWPGRPAPGPGPQHDPRLQAEEAVRRLYPALLEKEQPAREARTTTRASLDVDLGRKKYVKRKKKAQMRTWLWSLDAQGAFERMNAWERGFAEKHLEKFERWGECTKWVTQAQYDVAENLAAKYLYIPGRRSLVGPPPTPHDVAPPKDSCDAPMCDRHAATVGKNIHHCPDHAEPQFDSMNADAMSERDETDSAGSAGQGFGRKGRP